MSNSLLAVVLHGQGAEHVVGRNLESVDDGDLPGVVFALEVGYVVVGAHALDVEIAVVGGDGLVQALDVAVGEHLHQRDGLEHGAGLHGTADRHVADLFEVGRAGVAVEVDHCPDGAGGGFHQHEAGAFQVFLLLDFIIEGAPCNVLIINVEGGADVLSVFGTGLGAVVVEHAPVVGHLEPFLALAPVEHVVEFSLQPDVGVAHVGAIVPDKTDGAAGQLAVGIDANVLWFGNESAAVPSFTEEREFDDTVV